MTNAASCMAALDQGNTRVEHEEGIVKPGKHGTGALVFTAFEPSGDAHAAPIIEILRERVPWLRIYAWGGPRMQEAGATLIENTVGNASMGLGALAHVLKVRKQVASIRRWSKQYRVLGHVAVDSPAANFPICKVMRRKQGARVVHLVAPQLWAWGGWRKRKLRRLTDLVLCLLPFEEQWFTERQIPAKFIGHPMINRQLDSREVQMQASGLPQGAPRLAMFPGSRAQEVKANLPLMVKAFNELQSRHSGMAGLIVANSPETAKLVKKLVKVFPTGLHLSVELADAAIMWCDLALCVSGTITLQIASHRKPMIGVYKTGIVSWLGSKVLLRTPYCLLPNIIAGREIVPEFVPHIGGTGAIVHVASQYLNDSKHGAVQSEELARVCSRFANKRPGKEAARWIIKLLTYGEIS
jgi:lipid-A-disaccharide synthase